MNTYVEINENKYPALITGRLHDDDWNGRDSKSITLKLSYEEALNIFIDDVKWNIIQEDERIENIIDPETDTVSQELKIISETYDNSEYSIAGDIVDHRDGTITVKMGKPTSEELLKMIMEVL